MAFPYLFIKMEAGANPIHPPPLPDTSFQTAALGVCRPFIYAASGRMEVPMKTDMPYIHLFKTPGGFYIYDVNKNTVIHIDKATYELLEADPAIEEPDSQNAEIKQLLERGYLSGQRIEEIEHPANELLAFHLENKVNSLILQVTQQCNLRCEYCVYSGNYFNRTHANKRMGRETAFKAIDFLFSHSRDSRRINVGFYGGEPLLEFGLIKDCIKYAEGKSEGKKLTFNLTSNGTLLTDEVVEFFQEHEVSVLISLDGPREMHDHHRKQAGNGCGSFDIIMENLEMLKKKHPQYMSKIRFNVVLDPQSDFTCVNEFFTTYEAVKEAGKTSSIISNRYAKQDIKINEDFVIKRNYETFKVFLHKLGRLDGGYVSSLMLEEYNRLKKIHDINLVPTKSIGKKGHHGGPCVPGITRLFINAYGDFYPCERVSEQSGVMKIGNIDTGFDIAKIESILNVGRVSQENCRNCWAFRFCYMCAAFADNDTELSVDKKVSNCGEVRSLMEQALKDYCTLKEMGHDFSDVRELVV